MLLTSHASDSASKKTNEDNTKSASVFVSRSFCTFPREETSVVCDGDSPFAPASHRHVGDSFVCFGFSENKRLLRLSDFGDHTAPPGGVESALARRRWFQHLGRIPQYRKYPLGV